MATIRITNDAPDFTKLKLDNPDYVKVYHNAMNYCHYELSLDNLVSAVKQWLKQHPNLDAKKILAHPEYTFESVGKFCYMIIHGAEFSSEQQQFLQEFFEKLQVKEIDRNSDESPPKKKVVGIQEHIRDKVMEICGEIESWVDDFHSDPKKFTLKNRDVSRYFREVGVKPAHCRYIVTFYTPIVLEVNELLEGNDNDLAEGYSHLKKNDIRVLADFYSSILNAVEDIKSDGSANRKPRKKKATDINKLVSKVKYLDVHSDSGIKSTNPVHIVGSKSVWVYNTKTKKLGCYVAKDGSGLSIKGSSIINFLQTSKEKAILKGTVDLVKFSKMKHAQKLDVFKNMDTIDICLNGKLTESILIIEVVK